MKQFKTSWLVCLAIVLFVIIACAVFLFEPRRNRFYKVEREFVYWHDADATNRLCELDSGTRGYMGPSAAYVFEERLKMYSPTCIVNRVIDRLRKDHPEIVSSDSEIRDVLSAAEYFNSGIIVPHVHVIVRSGDANLSLSVAESFVDVVADAVEEDSARTRSKAIDQIQRRLLRLQEERKLLSSASRTTEKTEMEIRRIDTAIEGLNVDIERIKSLGSNTELRVFRVRDGVGGRSGDRDHTGAALQPSLEHGQGREARGGGRRRDGDDDGRARVLRNSHQVMCGKASWVTGDGD